MNIIAQLSLFLRHTLVLSTHQIIYINGIFFFINKHQISLRPLFKITFKQLQVTHIQLIIMHVMSDSPILGFVQVT